MRGQTIKPGVLERLGWAFGQWRVRRPPARAWLRLLWHDFVIHPLFEGGERCQDCGRDYPLWSAPNHLYVEVHGSGAGLLCPACFDLEAREKGIVIEFVALPTRGQRHG